MIRDMTQMVPPFPYFGGKRHLATRVWELLGDPQAYVEPFAGSAAVLLGRPHYEGRRREIINDLDGWVTNLWRAIRDRPDEVAAHATGPMTELDVHARLAWLNQNGGNDLVQRLEGDPEWSDPRAAGWWLYATTGSIGGGTRPGPWKTDGERLTKTRGATDGICRSIPHISRGRHLTAGLAGLPQAAVRMREVVITCGDWKRPLSKALRAFTSVGVLLDPPYEERTRSVDGHTLYTKDGHHLSAEVRSWCREALDLWPTWRIVVCGYDDEHDELLAHGYRKIVPPKGRSGGGYNMTGLNGTRDRLWASPACLELAVPEPGGDSLMDLLPAEGPCR